MALLVDNVNVAVFDVASVIITVAGLKAMVTPVGNTPVVLRLTAAVKPASGVILIVYCACPPGTTFLVVGEMSMAKSGVDDAGADATNVR